ncbi:MAG: 3'-5' exonuclease, partial [Kiloniellales bacterium]
AVPAEAAGRSLRARLKIAAEQVPTSEASDRTATEAALHLLSALAARCGDDAARFAEALPLASEADGWDPRAERISLLTLHAAKGLEFPLVFIVGLEDGILPLYWGRRDPAEEAEERRLFYVGMTRAMDRLFLCRAEKRLWRGALRELPPSRFLAAIEEALIEESRSEARRKAEPQRQMELF